jgi:uncharacterized membrane protein
MILQEKIFDFFSSLGFSPKTIILFLGTLPITELRASIPIGILLLKQSAEVTFIYSIIGNILPIAPIYFLLDPLSKRLSRTKCMQIFFDWLYKRAKEKAGIIERYEALGLMIFVAIPLPGTGAWTGTMVASILRMRFIPAFISVALGVVIAACIVTVLTLIGRLAFSF